MMETRPLCHILWPVVNFFLYLILFISLGKNTHTCNECMAIEREFASLKEGCHIQVATIREISKIMKYFV